MKTFSHTQTITDIHTCLPAGRDTHTQLEKSTIQHLGWKAVCACVCLCVAIVLPSFSADIMTGKLANVQGEVEVQKRGTTEWATATADMTIGPGDQINTGLTGHASLIFKNSTTEIEPFTQFVVGRALEDKDNMTTELFLQVGKVSSAVNPASGKKNKFTVTTPSAVAGVRGTKQECSFNKGFGTEVKIKDGTGYMAPVRPEALPPAVQAMLGVAPAGGGREGGVGKGDEKGKGEKKGEEGPKTVQEAVAEFNAWLQQSEQAAAGGGAEAVQPLLDPQTLDYAIPVADGMSATVQNAADPKSIIEPTAALIQASAPSVVPAGSTPAEQKAAQQSTEVVDAPAAVSAAEAQSAVQDVIETISHESSGGSTTTVTPPNRPTQGQSQGQ